MWPVVAHAVTATHVHTNKHAHAVEVYLQVLSFKYSVRCLTLKGGASALASSEGKGVEVYTKHNTTAFTTQVLSEKCVDWLFVAD